MKKWIHRGIAGLTVVTVMSLYIPFAHAIQNVTASPLLGVPGITEMSQEFSLSMLFGAFPHSGFTGLGEGINVHSLERHLTQGSSPLTNEHIQEMMDDGISMNPVSMGMTAPQDTNEKERGAALIQGNHTPSVSAAGSMPLSSSSQTVFPSAGGLQGGSTLETGIFQSMIHSKGLLFGGAALALIATPLGILGGTGAFSSSGDGEGSEYGNDPSDDGSSFDGEEGGEEGGSEEGGDAGNGGEGAGGGGASDDKEGESDTNPVPEPASMVLLSLSLVGFTLRKKQR